MQANPLKVLRPLLVASVALGWAACSSAQAAERTWSVEGASLRIVSPCARHVTIEPSSELHNRVEIAARAEHVEEIDALSVAGGSVASITLGNKSCAATGPHLAIGGFLLGLFNHSPTLDLTLRVPVGSGLDLHDGGISNYQVGMVGGPLTLALSGSGNLQAGNVLELSANVSGSGDARIDAVNGPIDGRLTGSGSLSVGQATSATTTLMINGSGDVKIIEGAIGNLSATLHGSGKLLAPATNAVKVLTSGSGDVALGHVNGPVEIRLSGSSALTIESIAAPATAIQLSGSSPVRIGAGNIGALTISSSGSSNVTIGATIGDADVNVSGSGDISIAQITGRLNQSHSGSGSIQVAGH
jgi:hypothetical protein